MIDPIAGSPKKKRKRRKRKPKPRVSGPTQTAARRRELGRVVLFCQLSGASYLTLQQLMADWKTTKTATVERALAMALEYGPILGN